MGVNHDRFAQFGSFQFGSGPVILEFGMVFPEILQIGPLIPAFILPTIRSMRTYKEIGLILCFRMPLLTVNLKCDVPDVNTSH